MNFIAGKTKVKQFVWYKIINPNFASWSDSSNIDFLLRKGNKFKISHTWKLRSDFLEFEPTHFMRISD